VSTHCAPTPPGAPGIVIQAGLPSAGQPVGSTDPASAWVIRQGFWSSSVYAGNPNNAWNLNFNNGNDNNNDKDNAEYVRLVRGGK